MIKEKTVGEKIQGLMLLHKDSFDRLGITHPVFIPRICYTPVGEKEPVVSFFEQDFSKAKDIYTHFVSKGYVSEDPQNRLWKWTYNPYYATEYKKSEPHPETGNIRYIIPVEELELVNEDFITNLMGPSKGLALPWEEDEIPDPNQDLPLDQMTIRDLAAMLLKRPVSRKTWLNDIILDKKQ